MEVFQESSKEKYPYQISHLKISKRKMKLIVKQLVIFQIFFKNLIKMKLVMKYNLF